MSFVNKKIGNGFLMNAVDSTKDQEHYFGGARKHLEMAVVAFTGTQLTPSADGFVHWSEEEQALFCTSSAGLAVVSGTLVDKNGVRYSGSFINEITNGKLTEVDLKQLFSLSVEISHSVGTLLPSVSLTSSNGTPPEILRHGTITALTGGWVKYELLLAKDDQPSFSLNLLDAVNEDVYWIVNINTGTKAFRNFKLKFFQELSDNGVQKLKELDNQHTEKITTFLNRDVLKGIE